MLAEWNLNYDWNFPWNTGWIECLFGIVPIWIGGIKTRANERFNLLSFSMV